MSCVPGMPCYGGGSTTPTGTNCGADPCDDQLKVSDLIKYVGPDLPCTGIDKCDDLTTIIQKLEQAICDLQNCCNGTTTTTTSSSSTTTTTTTTGCPCNNYEFVGIRGLGSAQFTFIKCGETTPTTIDPGDMPVVYCVSNAYPIIQVGVGSYTKQNCCTPTTTTTTTLPPLNFTISYLCDVNSVLVISAVSPTGGSGTGYQFGSTTFATQAAALANVSWLTATSIAYTLPQINGTYWVALRDSLGNVFAKSVIVACPTTTTTTTSSTTTTTTTLIPGSCVCFSIENPIGNVGNPGAIIYPCGGPGPLEVTIPAGTTNYYCVVNGTVPTPQGSPSNLIITFCGTTCINNSSCVGCGTTTTTTSTTTALPQNLRIYLSSEAGNGSIPNSEVYYSIQPPPYIPTQPEPLGLTWTLLANGLTIPECPTVSLTAGTISVPAGSLVYVQVRDSGGVNIYQIGYNSLDPCTAGVIGTLYTYGFSYGSPAPVSAYLMVKNPITTVPHVP